ncbi:ATP-dependent nuclease [Cellulosilyticum sp. I15G10I2]|uniref:ATP-dependent nuclease n=1 Tax=Cellulosilyticum sp. I15G10I2 TaxID=1892843 RepID=UPI00085C6329|nr:AAA family ATPase [Cellulosilyticum sp. I15G10I2]
MKNIDEWLAEISIQSNLYKEFNGMDKSESLREILKFFLDNNVGVGTGTSYYYLTDNSGFEARANLYYGKVALFKVILLVNAFGKQNVEIKVEKVRKAENNLKRVQDISKELKKGSMDLFNISHYYTQTQHAQSNYTNFKLLVSKLKHAIDIYNNNINKIVDKELMLKNIRISNFKKIIKASVTFDNENDNLKVLVGTNNAGKTSFIQGVLIGYHALSLLDKSDRLEYDEYGQLIVGSQTGVRYDKIPFLLSELIDLFNCNARANMAKGVVFCTFYFENEMYIEIGARLVAETYSVFISRCSQGISHQAIVNFIDRPITLIPSFFNVVTDEERKTPARYNSMLKSGNYNQLFRNILLDLKNINEDDAGVEVIQENKFFELQKLVRDIFGIQNLDVSFNPEEDEYIIATYEVTDNINNRNKIDRIDISTLGMGTLQFIQVIAQILLGKPSMILLDEPDAHLHAKLQVEIIKLFEQFSNKYKTKFLIATHSKDIINSVNPHNVVMFNSKSELIGVEEYDAGFIGLIRNLGATTEELVGLNLGKRVVIVEGIDDKENLDFLCKEAGVNKCKNYNMIKILPLGGRKNVLTNQWDKFITIEDNEFKKLAVFDRDFRPIEKQKEDANKLRKKGFGVVEWSKKEFENYLLIPDIIAKVINEEYPQTHVIESQDIIDVINMTYEETKESIVFEYEKCMEIERKKEIKNSTGDKIADIELSKPDQIDIRRKVNSYLKSQEVGDIVCGKETIDSIRVQLIIKSTPTREDFVKKIISKMIKTNKYHSDIDLFISNIKEMIE